MANYTPHSFESLLISNMFSRLQTRPPYLDTTSFISNACDRIIADETKPPLQREEAKLEKNIVQIILSGEGPQKLRPNSGQAVSIGEHQVCVGFHEEPPAAAASAGYRVWEWHGHIMLHDEEEGYTAEYVYGNYFEKENDLNKRVGAKEEEEELGDHGTGGLGLGLGLGGLIGGDHDENNARILCRNISAGSLRKWPPHLVSPLMPWVCPKNVQGCPKKVSTWGALLMLKGRPLVRSL